MTVSVMYFDRDNERWREIDVYDGEVAVTSVAGTQRPREVLLVQSEEAATTAVSNSQVVAEPAKPNSKSNPEQQDLGKAKDEPNRLMTFSAFMKDNWGWIAGVLAMIGGAITWTFNTFFKKKEPVPEAPQPRGPRVAGGRRNGRYL